MTDEEFTRLYSQYRTVDRDAAIVQARAVVLDDGEHPLVVRREFSDMVRYALMPPSAARYLESEETEEDEDFRTTIEVRLPREVVVPDKDDEGDRRGHTGSV